MKSTLKMTSYLLLHSELLWKFVAENSNTHVQSLTASADQEFGSAWVAPAQNFSWRLLSSEGLTAAQGSVSKMVCSSGWQLGRKLSPSPCGPIHGAAWVWWLASPGAWDLRHKEETLRTQVVQPPRLPSNLSTISIGHRGHSVWEVTVQVHGYQKARIFESRLGDWPPHQLPCNNNRNHGYLFLSNYCVQGTVPKNLHIPSLSSWKQP